MAATVETPGIAMTGDRKLHPQAEETSRACTLPLKAEGHCETDIRKALRALFHAAS